MKQRFALFIFLFFLFTSPSVIVGQNCRSYTCTLQKVEHLFKKPQKDYGAILSNLDVADAFSNSDKNEIKNWRWWVFNITTKEKNEALETTKIEKNKADSLFKISEEQKIIIKKQKDSFRLALLKVDSLFKTTEVQRKKIKETLGKIYFHNNKFGVAYNDEVQKYGFVDKNLETTVEFQYVEASSFDYNGYAKVRKSEKYYKNSLFLLDTLLDEYKLAIDVGQFTPFTKAIDFQNRSLQKIPNPVFKQTQNEVLLLADNELRKLPTKIERLTKVRCLDLKNNQLKKIPKKIGKLCNLRTLNLVTNKLTYLPKEIAQLHLLKNLYLDDNNLTEVPTEMAKLINLEFLSLRQNPISKEEQEKIKVLLPNCKIIF